MSSLTPPPPGRTMLGLLAAYPNSLARFKSRWQSTCSASQLRRVWRVHFAITGVDLACSVKSFPQTDINSGAFFWFPPSPLTCFIALDATMPSNGIRIAWIRSGWICSITLPKEFAAPGNEKGAISCRNRVRNEIGTI